MNTISYLIVTLSKFIYNIIIACVKHNISNLIIHKNQRKVLEKYYQQNLLLFYYNLIIKFQCFVTIIL